MTTIHEIRSHSLPTSARPLFSPSPLIRLDQASLRTRNDYDDYFRKDLGARVFVDFEVFIKTVLHVPADWKTLWGPAIKAITGDCDFKERVEQYLHQCINPASPKNSFYEPLMDLMNAIVDALLRCDLSSISRGSQYHHHRNCPLSGTKHLHWENTLHVLEARQNGDPLCDRENIPRLNVNGIDPILNHAPYRSPWRDDEKKSSSTRSKKPSAEGSHTSSESARETRTDCWSESSLGRSDCTSDEDGEEDEISPESNTESDSHINLALCVFRHLQEKFSDSLLRSHATSGLVDRDRLQLYHANRSVILVSSAINFSCSDGLKKFIAFFIASYRLSLEQNGIPDAQ